MKTKFSVQDLRCPKCSGRLSTKYSSVVCLNCGKEFNFYDDILDLVGKTSPFLGEIPHSDMHCVLEIARAEGCAKALRYMFDRFPELAYYVLSPDRIDWIFHCLGGIEQGSCLDIGSGWGNLTFSLAKYFSKVWSMDLVSDKIEFQSIWKRQLEADNVRLLRANMTKLPFDNNRFDLVVANGILEWVGYFPSHISPTRIQLSFLREANRVLKNSGCLYLGVDNRIGLQFLFGGKDHSGLSFTSLMPRSLANIYTKLFANTSSIYDPEKLVPIRYSNYTYTLLGYLKLLRKAGFRNIKVFWVYPSYNSPKHSGPFEDLESFRSYLKHVDKFDGSSTRKKLVIKIAKYTPLKIMAVPFYFFFPNFLIFAYKNKISPNFESELLRYSGASKYFRKSGSKRQNYFLLDNFGKIVCIAKTQRYPQKFSTLVKEKELLKRFSGITSELTEIKGRPTLFVPFRGKPLNIYDITNNLKVIEWLTSFQQNTSKGALDIEALGRQIHNLLLFTDDLEVSNPTKSCIRKQLEQLIAITKSASIQTVASHGDLWYKNILINESGTLTILDWEHFKERDVPLFDILFFVITNAAKQGLSCFYENFLGRGKYSHMIDEILNTYCTRSKIPVELCIHFVPYTILRFLRRESPKHGSWKTGFPFFRKLLEVWAKLPMDYSWSFESHVSEM